MRNEVENLRRLALAVAAQTLPPTAWMIVDTGSTDSTLADARALAAEYAWVSAQELPVAAAMERGGPIARAFEFGAGLVPAECEVIVKLDADISMDPDHFDRLIAEFERADRLGIAGGIAYERDSEGVWRQRHGTGVGIWGASRAYRRACLDEILPLEERMGWDTIDLVSAEVRGWETRAFDLPFLHHRGEGERERNRFAYWRKRGDAAHYMGYRPTYLIIRTVFRLIREPWALGMLWGYAGAVLRRDPRCPDPSIRAHIREQQRLSRLPLRAREALRRRVALGDSKPL